MYGPTVIGTFSIPITMDYIKKCCETTSLHGWSRLQTGSWINKTYWIAGILVSISLAVFFICKSVTEFSRSTVDTKLSNTNVPLSRTYFPKLTICNAYRVRQSFVDAAFGRNNSHWETLEMKKAFLREFLKGYTEEIKARYKITKLYEEYINKEDFWDIIEQQCPYKTGMWSKGCKLTGHSPFKAFKNHMPLYFCLLYTSPSPRDS